MSVSERLSARPASRVAVEAPARHVAAKAMRRIRKGLLVLLALVLTLANITPLIWTFLTGFKTRLEIFTVRPHPVWVPATLNWQNYNTILDKRLPNLENSIFITLGSTLGVLLIAVPAAFALAVDPGNADLQARVAQARGQRAAGAPTLPPTLASERACNPFLRSRTPAVREALSRHAGHPIADDVEAFACLRRWKDGFRG